MKTAARKECEKVNADFEFVGGGKHEKIVLRGKLGQRTIAFSRTPSCQFAHHKLSRNVKHALRELGYDVH